MYCRHMDRQLLEGRRRVRLLFLGSQFFCSASDKSDKAAMQMAVQAPGGARSVARIALTSLSSIAALLQEVGKQLREITSIGAWLKLRTSMLRAFGTLLLKLLLQLCNNSFKAFQSGPHFSTSVGKSFFHSFQLLRIHPCCARNLKQLHIKVIKQPQELLANISRILGHAVASPSMGTTNMSVVAFAEH